MKEIIIDCAHLSGKSNKSINDSHENLKRFKTEKEKRRFIQDAKKQGITSFISIYDPGVIKALKGTNGITCYVIVPNVSQYVRDKNNYGTLVMGIKKLMELKFGLVSLIPSILKGIFSLLKKDFSKIVLLLVEIEMVRLKQLNPKVIFLHPQMTDLFIANSNMQILEEFAQFINKKYGVNPGLFTYNFTKTISGLEESNINQFYFCTPINKRGYAMRPNQKSVEEKTKDVKSKIIGYDITCSSTINCQESLEYASKLNIDKVIFCDTELKEVG